jgi:hypothetical protein
MTYEELVMEVMAVCKLPERFFLESLQWEKSNAHKATSLGLLLSKWKARKAAIKLRMFLFSNYRSKALELGLKGPTSWEDILKLLEIITPRINQGNQFYWLKLNTI